MCLEPIASCVYKDLAADLEEAPLHLLVLLDCLHLLLFFSDWWCASVEDPLPRYVEFVRHSSKIPLEGGEVK